MYGGGIQHLGMFSKSWSGSVISTNIPGLISGDGRCFLSIQDAVDYGRNGPVIVSGGHYVLFRPIVIRNDTRVTITGASFTIAH